MLDEDTRFSPLTSLLLYWTRELFLGIPPFLSLSSVLSDVVSAVCRCDERNIFIVGFFLVAIGLYITLPFPGHLMPIKLEGDFTFIQNVVRTLQFNNHAVR